MKTILISNNPLVWVQYPASVEITGTFKDVLIETRTRIHQGHRLLTHPLTGSIKPNQTPYKSLFLTEALEYNTVDLASLQLIENSIATINKLGLPKAKFTQGMLDDFQVIDLSFVEAAWDSLRPLGIVNQ